MLRKTPHTFLTADFEVYDVDDLVGSLRVKEGVIYQLDIKSGVKEDYRGQILFKLLSELCKNANQVNANLSIQIPEMKTQRLKRVLDKFSFQETHKNVFKRLAGCPIPASVIY